MLTHTRWWAAATVLIPAESLVRLWLDGDLRDVTRMVLIIGMLVCLAVGAVAWFRWTQRDEAVRSPVEPVVSRTESGRRVRILVGALLLFVLVSWALRSTLGGDSAWYRPLMSVAVVAFWGTVLVEHLWLARLLNRRGGS